MAEHELSNTTTWTNGALTRLAGVAVLVAFAYLLGTQDLTSLATASQPANTHGADHRHVEIREVTVPVAQLEKNGERVVIGAADGGLYLVDYNGFASPVQYERRNLLWR